MGKKEKIVLLGAIVLIAVSIFLIALRGRFHYCGIGQMQYPAVVDTWTGKIYLQGTDIISRESSEAQQINETPRVNPLDEYRTK